MIDAFGRTITYLRLSVTSLCNLRCRYCMEEAGVTKLRHDQMLSEEEMISAVRVCAGLGVNKVRITGGEPLVKKNILSLCEGISQIPGVSELSLTSNGVLLDRYAKDLVASGVKRINISLDTLDPKKYRYMTRIGELADVLRGLEAALCAGFSHVKINCVLIGGFNEDEIVPLARLTERYPVDVRFIEWMPMTDLTDCADFSYISAETVIRKLDKLIGEQKQEGVAQLFSLKNGMGHIGLIRPISRSFCADCNRIRLTSDGRIKPCLHDAREYGIKGLSEEEMRSVFKEAILNKPQQHPDLYGCFDNPAGRYMNEIGG